MRGCSVKFLTALEAAEFLKIKIDTLYSLVEKGQLPGAKVGGQWRFIDDDIVTWFKSQSGVNEEGPHSLRNGEDIPKS